MAKRKKASPASKGLKSILWIITLAVLLGAGYLGFRVWQIYKPIVSINQGSYTEFFIYPDETPQQVIENLGKQGVIQDMDALKWVAQQKKYTSKAKSGRYLLYDGWNANQLINTLRSGNQAPVKLVFNSVRTVGDLAGVLGARFAPDSIDFLVALTSSSVANTYGFTISTFPTMFLPNTYEMYWSYSVDQVFGRFAKEYKKFWNDTRKSQAQTLSLEQSEVSTLASIVKAETNMRSEAPKIAGVYLNRLRKNMPLQADPTLIFALGDFTIRRVLDEHKQINSPYNTYKFKGLPPGPINIPEIHYIDAVLKAEKHDFLYFCAKDDFSGYSNFAKTYREHLRNASKYHRAMNARGIYR